MRRVDGLIGADAALLLLEEMKKSRGSEASPDIFTYTTVITGVARAEVSSTVQIRHQRAAL